MRQKVIIVRAALELVDERLFEQSSVEASTVPSGENALDLCRQLPVDLVVLPDRMPRLSLKRFLGQLRDEASESRAARVVVLAGPNCPATVRRTRDRDLVVLEATTEQDALESAVEELLRKKPRAYTRIMVNIGVELDGADHIQRMCQAVNISETGILIRSTTLVERGTDVRFEIYLPEESAPVRGLAGVVRQTDAEIEGFEGMGLRFLRFEGLGEEMLSRFLAQKMDEEEAVLSPPKSGS